MFNIILDINRVQVAGVLGGDAHLRILKAGVCSGAHIFVKAGGWLPGLVSQEMIKQSVYSRPGARQETCRTKMVEQNRAYLARLDPPVAVPVFIVHGYLHQGRLIGVTGAADIFYTDRQLEFLHDIPEFAVDITRAPGIAT